MIIVSLPTEMLHRNAPPYLIRVKGPTAWLAFGVLLGCGLEGCQDNHHVSQIEMNPEKSETKFKALLHSLGSSTSIPSLLKFAAIEII